MSRLMSRCAFHRRAKIATTTPIVIQSESSGTGPVPRRPLPREAASRPFRRLGHRLPSLRLRTCICRPQALRKAARPGAGRSGTGLPRRRVRGLGLLDAVLASGVLAATALWAGQLVGDWAEGRAVAGEARTTAGLARAGRLLVAGDVSHAGRTHGVNAAPLQVALADLEAAGLRSPVLGSLTPGRRALTLWLWRPAAGTLVVIARARGDGPLPRLPGAADGADGVGALPGTGTRLRGPGVAFDMAPLNAALPGFATRSDLFALDHVALGLACRDYLYRVAVDCDGDGTDDALANTMAVGLDMGGNDLLGAGNVAAATATIGRLEGATEITGPLDVAGTLAVGGAATLGAVTVGGVLNAASVDIAGTLTVPELVATGGIAGADIAFDGALTVSGTARLGDADVETLDVETLNVSRLSADEADIGRIFADDVTATACTGCGP